MKNKAKKSIWDNKVFWAVISVFLSVLLWVYVTTSIGEVKEEDFFGVQIVFRGEDTLREREDLVISNVSANTVNVKLRATRRELSRISSTNLVAVIDVSKITLRGNYTIPLTMEYPSGVDASAVDVVSSSPQSVYFFADQTSTKSIEVRGEFAGKVVEGYAAGKLSFEPSTITLTGPQSELDKVSYAWISISRVDVDKTLEFDTEYVFMDSSDNPVTLSNVNADANIVAVTLPVTSTKEVPLTVDIIEGAGATAENVRITVSPQTIIITGDAAALEGINRISIGTVDLSSFTLTFEDKFPILLDNDIVNVTGITEASATIEVMGLETRRFSITNISVTNAPAGQKAELITQAIDVTIRGKSDVIEKIQSNNIRAVVDLSTVGSATGTIQPNARIFVDGYTGVGAIGEYPVYVDIY